MTQFETIANNATTELIEKKSKFIANAFYVETESKAIEIIRDIKKKYYDARHNCYAYSVIEENEKKVKFSDDRRAGKNSRTSNIKCYRKKKFK